MKALIASCLFFFIASALANAQTLEMVSHHDAQRINKLGFKLGESDPYWIFQSPVIEANTRRLQIPISLRTTANTNNRDILLEVFFKQLENTSEARFSPLHRLKYTIAVEALKELGTAPVIFLTLPNEIQIAQDPLIRLDIDNCAGCDLSFNATTNNSVELKPSLTLNGAESAPLQDLELDLTKWRLNDLEQRESRFYTTGKDPFLFSPTLAVNTSSLGGVLVKLSLNKELKNSETSVTNKLATEQIPISNIQLFYRTEQHAFVEGASTVVELPILDDGTEQAFYIPLDFISSQAPVMQLLTGLRLDVEHLHRLNSLSIVNKQAAKKYQKLIPNRMYQRKIQRASGRQIISDIINKLKGDMGFVISYGVLLILVAFLFRRAFKH